MIHAAWRHNDSPQVFWCRPSIWVGLPRVKTVFWCLAVTPAPRVPNVHQPYNNIAVLLQPLDTLYYVDHSKSDSFADLHNSDSIVQRYNVLKVSRSQFFPTDHLLKSIPKVFYPTSILISKWSKNIAEGGFYYKGALFNFVCSLITDSQ